MHTMLRILAPCVLLVALLTLSRTPHERLMVLVLEGARADVIRGLASTKTVPSLTALISSGVRGELVPSRAAQSANDVTGGVLGASLDDASSTVWTALARDSRPYLLVGVAGARGGNLRGSVVLPGPDPAEGFIGSNVGVIMNRKLIERGAAAWPYSLATSPLQAATGNLGANDRTPWIAVSTLGDAGYQGIVRAYALDEDTLYLSPVYTRYVRGDDTEAEPYIADDPSTLIVSSRAREYLPRHVSELASARFAAAVAVAQRTPWELFVYVDRHLALAEAIEAGARLGPGEVHEDGRANQTPSSDVADVYAQVDSRVSQLTTAAGPRGVILVVGVDAPSKTTDTVGWFAAIAPDASPEWLRSNVDDLAATIRYLLGLPHSPTTHPIEAITAAYPTRRRRVAVASAQRSRAVVPLTSTALRELSSTSGDAERATVTATSEP